MCSFHLTLISSSTAHITLPRSPDLLWSNETTSTFEEAFPPWPGESSSEEMLVFHAVFLYVQAMTSGLSCKRKMDWPGWRSFFRFCLNSPPPAPPTSHGSSAPPQRSQFLARQMVWCREYGFWRLVTVGVSQALLLTSCVALGKWLYLSESSPLTLYFILK